MIKWKELISAISSRNDPEMVKLINEMTIDQVNATHTDHVYCNGSVVPLGATALHAACFVNNTTAIAVLLGLNGIEVNPKITSNGAINMITGNYWFGFNIAHLNGKCLNGYTPIFVAAALKYKESFELLVQDERVDLKATAANVNGKVGGLPEIFELQGINELTQNMLTKLLSAMRKQPTVHVTPVDMPRTTELDILKDHENNFGKLLESGEMSDFRIICGQEIFQCHKTILFAQSNVLRTMFNNEMRETREDSMTITDLEPSVVKQLIKFIYTGSIDVEEAKGNVTKLLEVADRYELKGLTKVCENELFPTIDNNNVLEMITKADLYHADKLREVALKWIVANRFEIVKQEGWKEVLKKFPEILLDMVDAFTTKF